MGTWESGVVTAVGIVMSNALRGGEKRKESMCILILLCYRCCCPHTQ